MSIDQSIAATATRELARKRPIAITGEAPSEPEAAEAEVVQSDDSAGLDADGFVRVCLQLMRDNFLAKVGPTYRRTAAGWKTISWHTYLEQT